MNTNFSSSSFLKRALLGNATFSAVSGVAFLLSARPVASFLAFVPPEQVTALGIQLVVFAAWLFWLATRAAPPRWQVVTVIVLDLLWVAGSVALLIGPIEIPIAAKWAIAFVTDMVAVFALLQGIGLRKTRVARHAAA